MPLEFKGEPVGTIALQESVTIFEVKAIHEALLSVETTSPVTLDFAKTTEVDAAGLQLLLAFVLHHQKAANPVQLLNVSDELQATFALLGTDLTNTSENVGGAL